MPKMRPLVAMIVGLVLTTGGAFAQSAPPSITFGTAPAVSPSDGWTYYQSQNLTSSVRTPTDLDVTRTANALGNDPDKIYAFVRNEIEVVPLFGVKAGARGALIDKAGTPFDQAHLMVELLRAAGVSATYQLGTITLTSAQFNDWFGITNATAAQDLLANGGFPATVTASGSNVASVTMMHLWVRATIGGTTYSFDPAFKPHTVKTPINLDTAMGFNGATLLSNALSGSVNQTTNGTPQLRDVNRTSLRSTLQTYSTTLLNHLRTNWPVGEIGDIIGSRTISAYTGAPLRQTLLPYQSGTHTTFANDVPPALRTKITVNYTSFTPGGQTNPDPNHVYYLDEVYGEQIAAAAKVPSWSGMTPGFSYYRGLNPVGDMLRGTPNLRASINHCYAANSGTYLDRTLQVASGPHGTVQLLFGSGTITTDLGAVMELRHDGEEHFTIGGSGEDTNDIPSRTAAKRRLAAMYLAQLSAAKDMAGRVGGATVQMHDAVTSVATFVIPKPTGPGFAGTSMSVNLDAAFSVAAHDGTSATRNSVSRTVAFVGSALEGSIAEQAADSAAPVSTVAKFDWLGTSDPNAPPPTDPTARWLYYADSTNWSWVKTQILADYGSVETTFYSSMGTAEQYINAGYTLIIPRTSDLGPGKEIQQTCVPVWTPVANVCFIQGSERGGAFVAFKPDMSSIGHIVARGVAQAEKGGGGTDDIERDPKKIFAIPEDFLDRQFSARAKSYSVDLKAGKLTYTPPPDITTGSGDYPYSLSYQRSLASGGYVPGESSMETPQVDSRQSGWRSNFDHDLKLSSDGMVMFGDDRLQPAAATIAMFRALLHLSANGSSNLDTLQRYVVSAGVAQWWSDQILTNTATIAQAHSSRSFVKLADGTWQGPPGDVSTLEVFGGRTINWTPPQFAQPAVKYNTVCGRVTEKGRAFSLYGGWNKSGSGLLPTDWTCTGSGGITIHDPEGSTGGPGWSASSRLFRAQVFPTGVVVEASWNGDELFNNLGRSIKLTGTSWSVTVTDQSTARAVTIATEQSYGGSTQTVTDLMGNPWVYRQTPQSYAQRFATAFEILPPTTPTVPWFRFTYEASERGRVKTVADTLGNTTTYWVSTGRAASTVDALGNTSRVNHNRFGNVVRMEDALGRVTTTEYDNLRRKVKETAPEGNFVTTTYDARSNVLTETEHVKPGSPTLPASRVVSTKTYDGMCDAVLSDTNAGGNTTTWTINATTCQTLTMTQPPVEDGSPVTTYAYGAFGKLTQKTDPTGLVTQMTYDPANGNLLSVIVDPTGANITTAFVHDTAGNITSVTDPRGFTHTGTYDNFRRLTQYTAPASTNAKTKWTYDADGLVTKIERAANAAGTSWATTQYAYFATGRVASTTDADGRITRYTYDALGRPLVTIDPENRRTKKIYDAASQVIEERRGVGSPDEQAYSKFAYTLNGRQAWIKDAKDHQTTYAYDGYDRLEKTTFPDATFETLAYTLTDKVASKLTRGNQLIQNQYDALDREISHLVPQPTGLATTTSTTYDRASRVRGKSDTAGHSLVYEFDTAKRVIWVDQQAPTFAGTRRVTYELDLAGNKTRTTWPDGYNVVYDYDGLNRVTTVRENGTFLLSTYIYDTLSRRTSLVYGNGAAQGYTYSTQGDLLTLASALTATSNTYTNTFTPAHQLMSEAASNAAWAYVPAAFQTTNYAAANNLNQYVNITVGANPTVTLAYDANGNLTGDGVWTFAYDAQNMLRSSVSAASTSTYQYDPLGRRQMLTEGGVTTTFLHDGDEEIADYAAAAVLRRYVPGPGTDMPIAMVTPSGGSNTRKYFHTNRQGSTIAMSADDGTLSEGPYTYDAYGNGAPATGVPFKYTGRRLDAGTGLYYYRARYYSAALGRFLQVDPVGYKDQMNLYGYVNNDPSNLVDPTGRVIKCTQSKAVCEKFAELINKRTHGTYRFRNGKLERVANQRGHKGGSRTYSSAVDRAIASKKTLELRQADVVEDGYGRRANVDRNLGGGVTMGVHGDEYGDDQTTLISGRPNTYKGADNKTHSADPSQILMHEIVKHAVPRLLNERGSGPGNERRARAELKLPERAEDPEDVE